MPNTMTNQENDLQISLDQLSEVIDKRSRLGYRFVSGLLAGAGTAIGATVVAWWVIYIISQFVQQLDLWSIEFLQEFLESTNLLGEE